MHTTTPAPRLTRLAAKPAIIIIIAATLVTSIDFLHYLAQLRRFKIAYPVNGAADISARTSSSVW